MSDARIDGYARALFEVALAVDGLAEGVDDATEHAGTSE